MSIAQHTRRRSASGFSYSHISIYHYITSHFLGFQPKARQYLVKAGNGQTGTATFA